MMHFCVCCVFIAGMEEMLIGLNDTLFSKYNELSFNASFNDILSNLWIHLKSKEYIERCFDL
jgi:disulfide oxidoreductase YuzD